MMKHGSFKKFAAVCLFAALIFSAFAPAAFADEGAGVVLNPAKSNVGARLGADGALYYNYSDSTRAKVPVNLSGASMYVNKAGTLDASPVFDKVVLSYVTKNHAVLDSGADWDDVIYDVYSGGKKVTSGRGAFTAYFHDIFNVGYTVDHKTAIELPTEDGGMFYFYTPKSLKEWDSFTLTKYDMSEGGHPNLDVTEGVQKTPVDGYHTGNYGTKGYKFTKTADSKQVFLYNETDDPNNRQALLVDTNDGNVTTNASMPSSFINENTLAGSHGVKVIGLSGNTYKENVPVDITTKADDSDGYFFDGRGSNNAQNFAGKAELAGGSITLNGKNSVGIYVDGGYQDIGVTKNGGKITVNGENSTGIYAAGNYASLGLNGAEFIMNGANSSGITVENGANVNLQGTAIALNGAHDAGVVSVAGMTTVTADKFNITAAGENSSAFYAAGADTKLNAVQTDSSADYTAKADYGATVKDGAEILLKGVNVEGTKGAFYAEGDMGGTISLYSSKAKGGAAVENSAAALNVNIEKDSTWTLNKAADLGTGKLTVTEGGIVEVVDEGKIAAATLEKGGKLALAPEKYLDAEGIGAVNFNGGGIVSFSDGTLADDKVVSGAEEIEIGGDVKANADSLQSVVNNETGTLTLLKGTTTKAINGAGETKVNDGSEVTFGADISNKITNAGYIYTGANYLNNTVTNSGTVEATKGEFKNSGKIDGGTAILRKDVGFASENLTNNTTLQSDAAKYNLNATISTGAADIVADNLLDVKTATGTIKFGKVGLTGVEEVTSTALETQMQYLSDGAIANGSTLLVDDEYVRLDSDGIFFDFAQAYNTPWDETSGAKIGFMDVYAQDTDFTLQDVIKATKMSERLNLGKVDAYVLTENEVVLTDLGNLTRNVDDTSTPRELTIVGNGYSIDGDSLAGVTVAGSGGGAGDTLNVYGLTFNEFNTAIDNKKGGIVNLDGVTFTGGMGDYDVVNSGTLSTFGVVDLSKGIKNEAGGTINLNDGTDFINDGFDIADNAYDIENAGIINASGKIDVDNGIRNSETGILNVGNADFTSPDGEYEIVNDGTMNADGSVTFDTGLSGNGTLNVSGLAYTNGTIEQGNVNVSGILDSDSNITVSDELKLSNGTMYIEPGHAAVAGKLTAAGVSMLTGDVMAGAASVEEGGALLASGKIMSGNMNSYGVGNVIAANNTAVFGSNAAALHDNSVVLGNGSVDRAPTGGAYGVVSVGNVGMERQIINVANGEISPTSTDAVNGRQLYGVQEEARGIGAISAALAGLHFVEPSGEGDDKVVGAVAYGGYRGANAEAIGLAYKPNPNMMFSASTSISNGNDSQNAYNVGFSLKFGKGETAKTRAELQKQVKYLNEKTIAQSEENAALKDRVEKLESELEELKKLIKK